MFVPSHRVCAGTGTELPMTFRESLADVHDVDDVDPDNQNIFEPGGHSTEVSNVGEVLREVDNILRESGVNSGTYKEVSDKLKVAFERCEKIERGAADNGAYGLGDRMLIENPQLAHQRPLCEMLCCSTDFCIALGRLKVEALRIRRGEPHSGPKLTTHETYQLEAWGKDLAGAALNAWWSYFRDVSWPPAWGKGINDANGEPYQVPNLFRVLVCNLILMQLNLWPTIKRWLDDFHIKGSNIFEQAYWTDPFLREVLTVEPRITPFVVEADHIDVNELAPTGLIRRTNAPHHAAMDALDDEKKQLVREAVQLIQNKHGGRFRQQTMHGGWQATQYKWPREDMPRLRHLLGGKRWTAQ